MIKENVNMKQFDNDLISAKVQAGDCSGLHMTGQITDRIYKNGVLVEERVGHNLVVNSLLNLVMCLLKQQSGYKGLQYWAVGSGHSSWDSSMPEPEVGNTKLTAEIGRVAIDPSKIVFLNENSMETTTPTNVIQVSCTFNTSDCNGVWREFGIFGGNATTTINSGIMVNKKHHAVITKTSDMAIERVMKFTLSLT